MLCLPEKNEKKKITQKNFVSLKKISAKNLKLCFGIFFLGRHSIIIENLNARIIKNQ